ncbi:GAF domain-containing sensor histidine kinase [Streptosporangium sp. NPDC002524]|uniref:sensor histidine kinase n=1 Tax=Streptosporangium sp. NPDC002524 TaxID=3154537 RepID=UPI003328006F
MAKGESGPLIPHMRLDELLEELRERLEAVLATRDRVHALLDAVVAVGSDLDLETMLRRIVETATTLVDATYGALGVAGDHDTLIQFVPVGLSEEEIAGIEHWPHGLGLLGLLIQEPRTLRLARISDHRASYGFPPGHPPMGSFLGVPVRVREEVFGNLYLTEKRGGGEFDEEDEAIVTALATAAGVAIENARLYEETRRREMWLQASAEVTTSLLSGAEPGRVLTLIARRARQMAGADIAAVLLPDASGRVLRAVVADGENHERVVDAEAPIARSLAGLAFTGGEPVMVTDPAETEVSIVIAEYVSLGPVAAVPFGAAGGVRGVLSLGKRQGRIPFNQAEVRTLHAFAAQAAIALELAERRTDAERLGLLEDRDRIAKDLHDVVIQRLFAVAMTLMSTVRLVERPEASGRLRTAIDELDGTIRQIRSTIFALQAPGDDDAGLRAQIVDLVEGARAHLGFMPGLTMEGPLDGGVPPEIAEHLPAVLREALSNVVRHARASRAEVSAELGEERLVLTVTDDGVGLPAEGRRSGLRNLQERAEDLGGSLSIETPERGGTRLVWSVPLDPKGDGSQAPG